MTITPTIISDLRKKTNAGMMDCKAALVETNGDMDAAVDYLRKKGIISSENRSLKEANEGVIFSAVSMDGGIGAIIEIKCETDFVAKNDGFLNFASVFCLEQLFGHEPNEDDFKALGAEFGENIQLGRVARYKAAKTGYVVNYSHPGFKTGVLLEVETGKTSTFGLETFLSLIKDLTLQIAASKPSCVSRDQVDSEISERERSIYAGSDKLKGKPAAMIDKILDGMMSKFYAQTCLLEQTFIKDNSKTISKLIREFEEISGDTLTVKRFDRLEIGE